MFSMSNPSRAQRLDAHRRRSAPSCTCPRAATAAAGSSCGSRSAPRRGRRRAAARTSDRAASRRRPQRRGWPRRARARARAARSPSPRRSARSRPGCRRAPPRAPPTSVSSDAAVVVEGRVRRVVELAQVVAIAIAGQDGELGLGRAKRQLLPTPVEADGEQPVLELVLLHGQLGRDDARLACLPQPVEVLVLVGGCARLGVAQPVELCRS